jgi:hypothetical protein
MLAPNVEQIESAADMLSVKGTGAPHADYPRVPDAVRKSQMKELSSFGDARAIAIGASGVSKDFQIGYVLGLQAARVVLAGSSTLAEKGVDPSNVL